MPTAPRQPRARRPRGAINLNGKIVWGWISWEVDNNNFRSADTFRVEFALHGLPSGYGVDWFAAQASLQVEIFATEDWIGSGVYAPTSADRLILGDVDDIDFSFDQSTIGLSGRDLTARLIDTKTSENHQNRTSSDVATLLAQRRGLVPVVTKTTTRIGQFYSLDHTDINQQQSEWDLLCRLADFEGFDVFVTGNELHFQPKPSDTGDRYAIKWVQPSHDDASPHSSTTTLEFSRSLTIAKGVSVEVRSWNAKHKKAYTASWPKAAKGIRPGRAVSSDPNSTTVYHFHVPGLTQDQASARAQALYKQITAHMVKLTADLPGDGLLTCAKPVIVTGTGTSLDQVYYPDSVKRSMSMAEGYRMSLSAKNISNEIEAAAG